VGAAMGTLMSFAQTISIAVGAAVVAFVDWRLMFGLTAATAVACGGVLALRPAPTPAIAASLADTGPAATDPQPAPTGPEPARAARSRDGSVTNPPPAEMMSATVSSPMTPPDTTQTTTSSDENAPGASAHATGVAPAPSASTRLRSSTSRTAAATSATGATRDVMPSVVARSYMLGRTVRLPIPSTNDGCMSTVVGSPAASDAASGAAGATSHAWTRARDPDDASPHAMPHDSPPPPHGTRTCVADG